MSGKSQERTQRTLDDIRWYKGGAEPPAARGGRRHSGAAICSGFVFLATQFMSARIRSAQQLRTANNRQQKMDALDETYNLKVRSGVEGASCI